MKLKLPKIKLNETDILPLSVAALVGVQVVQGVALFLFASSYYNLAKQPNRTLVQRDDGTAFAAESKQYNYREAKVVRQFVKDWASLTFTWSGKLPAPDDEGTIQDRGIPVSDSSNSPERNTNSASKQSTEGASYLKNLPTEASPFLNNRDARVPTISWQAAFLLPDYDRTPFLQLLARDWVPKDHFSRNPTTTVFNIDYLGVPQLIDLKRGIWRVDLLSTINYFNQNTLVGEPRNFNRTLIVAPVEIPNKPVPQTASAYERIVYQMRERGLQIVEIRPSEVQANQGNNNVYRTPANSN